MDKSTIEKLMGNTPLALVVIGLFLVVIGAAGGWPNPPLQVSEFGWRIVLATIGMVIAGIGVLSYWRDRTQDRRRTVLSCDDCGIQIVSPAAGERVGRSFPVNGIYGQLPEQYAILVFTVMGDGKNRQYWPQDSATIDRQRKTWYSKVNYLGGNTGESKEIQVCLAGEEGQVLVDFYNKVGRETDKWPSITKLTSDIVECASVKVVIN